ncbi:MAG TPA: response regulator transcription factor [Gemmatimonadales bacterium]
MKASPPLRVVLAEDHTLVRKGIRAVLRQLAGVEVVAEAANGREAIELVRRHGPDVVVMDIAMSGLNGLEATARIAREFPQTRVLILSMHATEEYVAQALRAGATGYLMKGADVPEFELAIRSVARGEPYLTPAVSRHIVEEYLRRVGEPSEPTILTARQREILQLVAEGCSTKEIAKQLHLSVKTVEAHRGEIMNRLDIHDVAGLVRWAIRAGVVSLEG